VVIDVVIGSSLVGRRTYLLRLAKARYWIALYTLRKTPVKPTLRKRIVHKSSVELTYAKWA